MSFSGSESINALTAPDQYTAASTIENVVISRLTADIANQAIFINFKIITSGANGNWDSTEIYLLPQFKPFTRRVCGVRFRAAKPAAQLPAGVTQATVTIEAVRA